MIDAISALEMRDIVLILIVVVVTVLAKVQHDSIDDLRREIRKARNTRFDFE